jgi:hypothetical protein
MPSRQGSSGPGDPRALQPPVPAKDALDTLAASRTEALKPAAPLLQETACETDRLREWAREERRQRQATEWHEVRVGAGEIIGIPTIAVLIFGIAARIMGWL